MYRSGKNYVGNVEYQAPKRENSIYIRVTAKGRRISWKLRHFLFCKSMQSENITFGSKM